MLSSRAWQQPQAPCLHPSACTTGAWPHSVHRMLGVWQPQSMKEQELGENQPELGENHPPFCSRLCLGAWQRSRAQRHLPWYTDKGSSRRAHVHVLTFHLSLEVVAQLCDLLLLFLLGRSYMLEADNQILSQPHPEGFPPAPWEGLLPWHQSHVIRANGTS